MTTPNGWSQSGDAITKPTATATFIVIENESAGCV